MAKKEFTVNADMAINGDFKEVNNPVFVYLGNADNKYGGFSTDGLHWEITKTAYGAWKQPTYGNGKYVSFRDGWFESIYSTNGITWSKSSTMDSSTLYGWGSKLVYGNGKFITNESSGGARVTYSTDAITWETSTLPFGTISRSLMYGNNKFVIAGDGNLAPYSLAISTDAITWTIASAPFNYITGGAFGNGDFMIIGDYSSTNSAYSTDGITWTTLSKSYYTSGELIYANGIFSTTTNNMASYLNETGSVPKYGWYNYNLPSPASNWNLSSANDLFVISSTYADQCAISTDLGSWTYATTPTPIKGKISGGMQISYTASNLVYNNYGVASDIQNQIDLKVNKVLGNIKGSNLIDANLQENIFMATGLNRDLSFSTDGITWTTNTKVMPVGIGTYGWNPITYGGGIFLSSLQGWGQLAYSTDCVTWQLSYMPSNYGWEKMAYGNGIFVANQGNSNVVAVTTDGFTWTNSTFSSGSSSYYGPAYGNGIFLIKSPSSFAYYSTNGISWAESTTPYLGYPWTKIKYGGGKFITLAEGYQAAISSTNGITWTYSDLPTASYWSDVCFGNGIFLAVSAINSNATETCRSTDAITWEQGSMPFASDWNSVNYSNGVFLAASYGNSPIAAVSTDGINWVTSPMPDTSDTIISTVPIKSSINSKTIYGSVVGPITNSIYTVNRYDKYIIFSPTATCTITLPNAGEYPNREITIKNTTAFAVNSDSANVKPLATNTAGTAILTATAGKFAKLISDGSSWIVVKSN